MAITWLADVLRAAGLTVVEHAGWRSRAVPGSWSPRYGIVHATAAPRTQSDDTQVRIVRDGREGLRGPIANACVDRAGRWHVLAAGRCNTTVEGTAGPYAGLGNTYALGVEACNDNRGEPWPDVQYRAYVRGWAAIARKLGWSPNHLRGHKEHTPGHKTDPTFSMNGFRANVAALSGEGDDMTKEEHDALMLIRWILASGMVHPTTGERVPLQTWGAGIDAALDAIATRPGLSAEELAAVKAEAMAGAAAGAAQALTPEALAAAIPDSMAAAVADLLSARLAS